MSKKLAFLGPAGTFTEEAAVGYDPRAEHVLCATVAAAAEAVEKGRADQAVVAIENSIEGSVTDTLDLLIHDSRLKIKREIVIPITQCLIVKPGTALEQVQLVYSHPSALGQCRRFIERTFKDVQVTAAMSTVGAVVQVKDHPGHAAAIGPRLAAKLHGMQVLAEGIQDHPENVTRFVVLAFEDHAQTGRDKTSIAFSFSEDRPGVLYEALGAFAKRRINLAKVESRPSKESLGRYVFLVDLEGHRLDPLVAEALRELQGRTSLLKVFGSYPRFQAKGG